MKLGISKKQLLDDPKIKMLYEQYMKKQSGKGKMIRYFSYSSLFISHQSVHIHLPSLWAKNSLSNRKLLKKIQNFLLQIEKTSFGFSSVINDFITNYLTSVPLVFCEQGFQRSRCLSIVGW